MPYFFIAFGLAIYVCIGLAAVAVCCLVAAARPALGLVWRFLLWSVLGLLIANVVFMAAVMLFVHHADLSRLSSKLHQAVGFASGLSILLGPFAVSAGGLFVGGVVGTALFIRSRVSGRSAPA